MPQSRRSIRCMALLSLLGGAAVAARGGATEPQAAFAFKDGWVECVLRQNGKPVADGVIQVLDDRGRNFAEGQTGPEGETAFPLPSGESFTVEIKTGNRTADPIRLSKIGAHIEPARVLLSYGLRPCCRFKDRRDPPIIGMEVQPPAEPADESSMWGLAAAGTSGLMGLAFVLFALNRRCSACSRV